MEQNRKSVSEMNEQEYIGYYLDKKLKGIDTASMGGMEYYNLVSSLTTKAESNFKNAINRAIKNG